MYFFSHEVTPLKIVEVGGARLSLPLPSPPFKMSAWYPLTAPERCANPAAGLPGFAEITRRSGKRNVAMGLFLFFLGANPTSPI